MHVSKMRFFPLAFFLCLLPFLAEANVDKYKNKVQLIQKNGKIDSLIESNEALVLPLDLTNTELEYADRVAELANAYFATRRGKEALPLIQYLKNLKDDIKFYIPKFNGHFTENSVYLFDSSKKDIIKANNLAMLNLARANNDNTGKLVACENLAFRSKSSSKDTFLYYIKLFGELCESERHYKIYHTYLGEHFAQINTDTAGYHYSKALTHSLNTLDSSTISSSYTHYSDFLSSTGQFEFAIENALKGLDYLSPTLGAVDFRYINTYSSITEIYKDMEDFVQAEEYIKKAAVLAEKNKYKTRNKSIARIYGETLFSQKRYEEALVEFLKAKKGFEKSNSLNEKLGNLTGLATCYLELKDFENTAKVLDELKLLEKKMETLPKVLFRYYLVAGNLAEKQRNYKQAINYYLKSNKIATDLGLKAQSIASANFLANAYKLDNNWKKSNVYFEKAFNLREDLFNEDIISSTKKLDAVYQKAEQEKEIFKLNAQNDANAAVLAQKNKTLTIGGVALLIITALSFIALALYRSVKSKNDIIASALEEKDILLREIHHRVKNNLQVISSLLSLQSRQIEDKGIKQAINEGRNRVRSMALIHQNLYQKENLTGVSVVEYLNKLTSELFDTYNISADRIKLDLNIQDLDLDVETMVPLGLIINELVSNSLKHAFPDNRDGLINVSLKETQNSILLSIKDNGIGTTQENMENSKSFGNRLIKAFTNKLHGEFSVVEDNGTSVNLEIKSFKKAS